MRLTKNLIKRVASEFVGEHSHKLIEFLYGRKEVSEITLARQKFKRDLNLTRNLLYRLHNENLVYSVKKKDKRRGWYVYYWTLNLERFREMAHKLHLEKKEALKKRLEREQSEVFYICSNGCTRLNFDKAVDYNFKCPVCGALLTEEDNTKKILSIKKELQKIEDKISI